MARGFAQAPGASVEVLDAARRDLPRTHIALFAQSRNRAVRETIASRDDVPLGIQAALAQDDASEVRVAVAGNTHTTRSVLECLSFDKNRVVLVALLNNPCVPFDIVDRLAFHRKADIRELAAARLNDAVRAEPVAAPRIEDALFPELRERAPHLDDAHAAPSANFERVPRLVAQPKRDHRAAATGGIGVLTSS